MVSRGQVRPGEAWQRKAVRVRTGQVRQCGVWSGKAVKAGPVKASVGRRMALQVRAGRGSLGAATQVAVSRG